MKSKIDEIVERIKEAIQDDIKDFIIDLDELDKQTRNQNINNYKWTELTEYTVQTMYILSLCLGCGAAFNTIQHNGFSYKKQNKMYTLFYINKRVFLVYEKHNKRYQEEITKLNQILSKIKTIHHKEIIDSFLNKECSIFNHLSKDLRGLNRIEQLLDEIITRTSEKSQRETYMDLFLPKQAFPYAFEVRSYILNAFSTIEYIINCLLPFWEKENGTEWQSFLKLCRKNNPNIETWTDLYNPGKSSYKSKIVDYKEITTPAYIDVVNIGIEVLNEQAPRYEIKNKYQSLKQQYRNMITHGDLGTKFTYGLTLGQPSIDNEESDTMPIFNDTINLDLAAYTKVADFFNNFIDFCSKFYPSYWEYLMSSLDIPVDTTEYFKYTNGDLEKTRYYIKYISTIHFLKMIKQAETQKLREAAINGTEYEYDFYSSAKVYFKEIYKKDFTREEIESKVQSDLTECIIKLGINKDKQDDEETETIENSAMQDEVISHFKSFFPGTLDIKSNDEIKNMPIEELIKLMEQSKQQDPSIFKSTSENFAGMSQEEIEELLEDELYDEESEDEDCIP